MIDDRLKKWIRGSALERPARLAYAFLTGRLEEVTKEGAARVAAEQNRNYDEETSHVMRTILQADSNCIDVGCHSGEILDEMLRTAPRGQHYAFEPLPELYAALCEKYSGRGNVHIFDLALADAAGDSTFQHVVTNPAYSGLRRRTFDRREERVVEIRVRTARLDDVLPEDLTVRLIKIDVEGAELQVMRGAVNLLRRCRPFIIFEHGLGAADHYGTRPEEVFDLLADCGLHLSLMQTWLLGSDSGGLSRRQFAEQFRCRKNFYFLAHPKSPFLV